MIKKIRSLTDKYPIPAAFIAFVLIDVVVLGLGQLLSPLTNTLFMSYVVHTILIIVPVAIVFLFGFSSAFKKGSFWRGIICGLPLILSQVMSLFFFFSENVGNPSVDWKPWYLIVYSVFTIVGVGIREECIYRATIQNIIAKKHVNSVKGIWLTAIISSFLFGLTHMTNILKGGNPLSIITQSISAAFLGLLFSAIYLRSGNIWSLVFIHTLTDVASLSPSVFLHLTLTENLNKIYWSPAMLGLWAIYVGLSAFLLRPSKCKQICESLCFADEKSDEAPNT